MSLIDGYNMQPSIRSLDKGFIAVTEVTGLESFFSSVIYLSFQFSFAGLMLNVCLSVIHVLSADY
jgi:hypothetical protein